MTLDEPRCIRRSLSAGCAFRFVALDPMSFLHVSWSAICCKGGNLSPKRGFLSPFLHEAEMLRVAFYTRRLRIHSAVVVGVGVTVVLERLESSGSAGVSDKVGRSEHPRLELCSIADQVFT